MLIPLAKIDVAAVVAQIGSGKLRTSNPIGFGESTIGRITSQIPIVRGSFSDIETERFTG
jgi:hypothetical protein